ncbi:unnamed protein product [Moneuplotes crassus]|uniref:Uncharacterized protein n=1 Tax=Euplotes crassus TaxID=5936 RepID=A0AAD1XUY5_EUPCR|nr:unnamed protein product [Moneuplotes crassus]
MQNLSLALLKLYNVSLNLLELVEPKNKILSRVSKKDSEGSRQNSALIYLVKNSFLLDSQCFLKVVKRVCALRRSKCNFLTFLITDFSTTSVLLFRPLLDGFLPFFFAVLLCYPSERLRDFSSATILGTSFWATDSSCANISGVIIGLNPLNSCCTGPNKSLGALLPQNCTQVNFELLSSCDKDWLIWLSSNMLLY